jgi:hypothetical protein
VARVVDVPGEAGRSSTPTPTVARLEHDAYRLDVAGATLTVTDGAALTGEQLLVRSHRGARAAAAKDRGPGDGRRGRRPSHVRRPVPALPLIGRDPRGGGNRRDPMDRPCSTKGQQP